MDRGHAEYPVMKGFEIDLGVKGASDVAKGEQLSDKADKKTSPKGKIRVHEDDLTMDPELGLVRDAARRDIEDGYVADIQGERVGGKVKSKGSHASGIGAEIDGRKGYDVYNEMVGKGMAADISIDPYNVGEAMGRIADRAGMVCKELDGGIVIKAGGMKRVLQSAKTAIAGDKPAKAARGTFIRENTPGARHVTATPPPEYVPGAKHVVAAPKKKPVETKPVETKPVETKPVETKPVETKPAKVTFGQRLSKLKNDAGDFARRTGRGAQVLAAQHPVATAVGAGGVGLGAGIGAEEAFRKRGEEKCSGAPMKMKGLDEDEMGD